MKINLCLLILPALAFNAQAAVIYTQGSAPNSYFYADVASPRITADDFTIVASTTVAEVSWFGGHPFGSGPNGDDNFKIRFYSNGGTQPGTIINEQTVGAATRVYSGVAAGTSIYEYTTTLPVAIALTSGTYWISIINDTTNTPEADEWLWAVNFASAVGAQTRQSFDNGASWSLSYSATALFTLSVPEPGISLLLALTVPLVFMRRCRQ